MTGDWCCWLMSLSLLTSILTRFIVLLTRAVCDSPNGTEDGGHTASCGPPFRLDSRRQLNRCTWITVSWTEVLVVAWNTLWWTSRFEFVPRKLLPSWATYLRPLLWAVIGFDLGCSWSATVVQVTWPSSPGMAALDDWKVNHARNQVEDVLYAASTTTLTAESELYGNEV